MFCVGYHTLGKVFKMMKLRYGEDFKMLGRIYTPDMYIVTIGVRKVCTLRNLDSMHPDYVRSGDVAPHAKFF